ncbi:MAG TPA: twin-arginine translocation signal domain-containing protein [Acidimicrobiales bacterium]|nr:twin-arginine translocation signal domain-containing protein [Acidimicrobiales bacterium]
MSEITRRSFLKQSGATAAAAGALVATPKVLRGSTSTKAGKTAAARTTTAAAGEADSKRDLVVHVPDTRSDEVRLLVGERAVVLHDRALVSRLWRAAN